MGDSVSLRIFVSLAITIAAVPLSGCQNRIRIATPGPVVAKQPATPRGEADCLVASKCLWTCGPRRGRPWHPWQVELEGGPVWQTRNDVAFPGDTGTRFALDELTGSGPFPYGRVTVDYQIDPRHGVRAVIAPLTISETGTLDESVVFGGQTFAAGARTKAKYTFNSYRLTYRYLLWCCDDWSLHVGATAKIRDAQIELSQGGTTRRTTDLGFVPLLHVGFEKRIAPRWRFTADLDAAAAPQGRAFDFAAKLHYDIDDRWSIGAGYRTIEGGADNDTVYTFAWLHQALVSVTYRF